MRHRLVVLLAALCLLVPAALAKQPSHSESGGKNGPSQNELVDSGTFAIFQGGRQVGTESFSIHQYPGYNVTSSKIQLSTGQPNGAMEEEFELTLLPNGLIKRYELKQESPIQRTLSVEPAESYLMMHSDADGKKKDEPFFLSASDFILDDYFFSAREVLLWRYLATSCKPRSGGDGCDLIRQRIPILVPQRNTSSEIFVQFKGYDEMPLNGRPQHLRHFVVDTGGPSWNLWLNDDQKLLRISIPSENVEVLRQ